MVALVPEHHRRLGQRPRERLGLARVACVDREADDPLRGRRVPLEPAQVRGPRVRRQAGPLVDHPLRRPGRHLEEAELQRRVAERPERERIALVPREDLLGHVARLGEPAAVEQHEAAQVERRAIVPRQRERELRACARAVVERWIARGARFSDPCVAQRAPQIGAAGRPLDPPRQRLDLAVERARARRGRDREPARRLEARGRGRVGGKRGGRGVRGRAGPGCDGGRGDGGRGSAGCGRDGRRDAADQRCAAVDAGDDHRLGATGPQHGLTEQRVALLRRAHRTDPPRKSSGWARPASDFL